MKKKLLVGLGVLLLTASLSACQGNTAEESTSAIEQGQVEQQVKEENTEDSNVEEQGEADGNALALVYTDPLTGYTINTLVQRPHDAIGGIYAYDAKKEELMYVTSYIGDQMDCEWHNEWVDMSQYTDSTDIFDLLIENLRRDMFSLDAMTYDVEVLSTSEINGLEMTKFEGTITITKDLTETVFEYPVVAYGIAGKNRPVLVCCIDQSEDQSQHAIWIDKIDEAVATFVDGE